MEKYRKIRVVGKGSFGHALLVQSRIDQQYHIIKVINVATMDKKKRQETLNEVHVLKELKHPFIIGYKESFLDKKCLCIVMDFADGGDLNTRLSKQKKSGRYLEEDQVLTLFTQIALALQHIHSHKILHRDLKTQNVFLMSNGQVKVGDFGISRVLDGTCDLAETAIGTPYYLSPEICEKKPYNHKSDIWGLGCLLYEMLTYRRPFEASSIGALVLSILSGKYPTLPSHWSKEIRRLVGQMLCVDPDKRPSIDEILAVPFIRKKAVGMIKGKAAEHRNRSINRSRVDISVSGEETKESKRRVEVKRPASNASFIKSAETKPIDSKESTSACSTDYDYTTLMESLTNCIKTSQAHQRRDSSRNSERGYLMKFKTPEGAAIPGLSHDDSIATSIEIVQMYLEQELGVKKFSEAYRFLEEPPESDSSGNAMLAEILGKTGVKYLPLLYQLLVHENTFYEKGK